jgi:hypothetical protein
MPTDRSPGAALSIGTTSASKMSTSGSGRRRSRTFLIGRVSPAPSSKYAVAVLNDAFAAATATPPVCLAFM